MNFFDFDFNSKFGKSFKLDDAHLDFFFFAANYCCI